MRTPFRKDEPVAPAPVPAQAPAQQPEPQAQGTILEREINLSLINDKLNYVISTLNKIAEAAEIDLNK